MNRTRSLIVVATLLLALPAGIALARGPALKDCTVNPKAVCKGSDGPDTITGENVSDGVEGPRDEIRARKSGDLVNANGGNDIVHGDGGNDDVNGDDGDDFVYGDKGNDRDVEGDSGNDTVLGGPGDDGQDGDEGELEGGDGRNVVRGNDGDDLIDANASDPGQVEKIFGGEGKDEIWANDGVRDVIDCGRGSDSVSFDSGIDELERCETSIVVDP